MCTYAHYSGAAVDQYICVLEQNIMNEKLYFFLWWWIMFAGGVASSAIVWRIFVVTVSSHREKKIEELVNFDIWNVLDKHKDMHDQVSTYLNTRYALMFWKFEAMVFQQPFQGTLIMSKRSHLFNLTYFLIFN